ncbi:uncharacterized protein LOC133306085 [Gastrolobium bilobum]|uniref:uncharacterized protein LOC133306085 n=1 Tax=Gastrolobium bilobum TaxID=150636 RepID=UPI002AB12EA8|nr:uncharacterized protein LOC133306085 [Gastrolobium bilobum]
MKNASKNKFLNCFRPVVDIDAMLESRAVVDHSDSRKTMFSDQECQKITQNWVEPQRPKRTLAKVIKVVVFETLLNTRARNKNRYSQSCFGSKRDYSAYAESSSTGSEKSMSSLASGNTKIQEIKAPELSFSSSSSSTPVSESKNISKCASTKDQLEKQKKCLGIYLVLVSLVVTVLWGKIHGIILTSMSLCLFSLWITCCCRQKEVDKLCNTEFKTNKNSDREHNVFT